MTLAKSYNPKEAEPRLQAYWQEQGVYQFDPDSDAAVRRYKSERNLPLGAELDGVQLAAVDGDETLLPPLRAAVNDLKSITRAHEIGIHSTPPDAAAYARLGGLTIWIKN